ncbi:MAG: nitrite/sulfite reductase [Hydrogenophilaceae bacterium]|jgi:sulfite reductase (NADPH) hemoprotein beta-component|nr:nitrite/sulfite reductase [Hydrogenophilaceae bacterium]
MYRYDEFDAEIVRERIEEFRAQVERRLKGEITEDQFKPLRLMNGLYLQLHAYMLRVAIPYGTLSSRQLARLARIARDFDKGYGHFTTRQNIQYNWVRLVDVVPILEALAEVEMHAIQTSGNCIRNVTADHFAAAAADEVDDPRVWSEIIRQWSTFHPEFSFLPRKFKIAVTAAETDRAAVQVHDIGLHLKKRDGKLAFTVYVGGGQGRTPFVAPAIRDDLAPEDLLSYLEAILRVYNRAGRRDNLYKSRIKILVSALGAEEFARQVEEEWRLSDRARIDLPADEEQRIRDYFAPPCFRTLKDADAGFEAARARDAAFARWVSTNVHSHRTPGYASVTISLKPVGGIPGDATAAQMEAVAALGKRYSFDEIRVSHEQNLILPHVEKADLHDLWQALKENGLATPNAGLISDIIACPGLDYCDLANARSIPIAQGISNRFADLEQQAQIGELKIKISGCINACGHHHVGHIGILGVDKHGEEFYQILLGGRGDERAKLGKITGKGLPAEAIPDAIARIVARYIALRTDESERFIDAYERLGPKPFEEALYAEIKELAA